MKTILFIAIILFSNYLSAFDKKTLKKVDLDAFTTETQIMPKMQNTSHISLVWWIPNEFWDATFSQEKSMSEVDKNNTLKILENVSLLAVVQADISTLGSFNFYNKDEVEKNLSIKYTDTNKKVYILHPQKELSSDLELMLNMLKPVLGAAMGNMGNNFHFFVLKNTDEHKQKLINPYIKGNLEIGVQDKKGDIGKVDLELPLNSLYVPRLCPNGKEAHISWNYCPWSGKKL